VRGLRGALEVPWDLLRGRYPPFVTGGPLPHGHVPVFVFHTLERESFARKLEYLDRNGYVTLSLPEYLSVLREEAAAPPRAVLLTFDDGRASVRTVGLPLMRRHGFRGVVFLVPGRIESRPGPLPPTSAEDPEATEDRDLSDQGFLTWEEIADLQASGLFEFESHTLRHARIHTQPEIVGFMHPGLRRGYRAMDVPLVREGGSDVLAPSLPLGTPLLRSEPRTSESRRFLEDEGVRGRFRAFVEEQGEGFFERPGWEGALRAAAPGPIDGRLEGADEQAAEIDRELREARSAIEARTGRPVRHLCYPWHSSGPTAQRLAREAGYETAFCGKVPGVPMTLPGGDLLSIARVGEDYVKLLPGAGRSTIGAVLHEKWSRRSKQG
jgi:peptidoglycan/xylan/chitin deacetylase (PgdA/CDA1 family)